MRSGFKLSLAAIALMGSSALAMSSAYAYSPIGSAYPTVGADTAGPGFLISIGPGNVFTITDLMQPTYDGGGFGDDTYVGVQNMSGAAIGSFTLTSSSAIFGFDGDGLTAYGIQGNPQDSSGYGGPDVFFTNITSNYSGTVNFIGGLANGQQTYFGLEEALTGASAITGGGVTPPTVPLPASLPMFGGAVLALGLVGYGMKRRSSKAGAAAMTV